MLAFIALLSLGDAVPCPAELDPNRLYALRDVFNDRDLERIVANPVWRALVTTPGIYAHNVVPFADGDEQAASYLIVVEGRLDLHVPLAMPAPYVGEVTLRGSAGKTWCARATQGFYSGKLSWLRMTTPPLNLEVTVQRDGKPQWHWQGEVDHVDLAAGRVAAGTGEGNEAVVFYIVPPEPDTYDVVEYKELVSKIDPQLAALPPVYPSTPVRLRIGM